MLGILERIAGKKKEAEAHRHSAYLALVNEIAAGEDVDDDQAARALAESSKSPEDLDRDVKTTRERNRIRGELAKLPDLRKQVNELQAKIAAANAKLEAAQIEYDRVALPAADQLRAVTAAIRDEGALRHKLSSTCLDVEAVTAWNEAKAKLGVRTQERDRLRPQLRDMRELASTSAGLSKDAAHAERAEQHREAAARQNKLADEYQARLGELDAEIAELEAAERKAREAVERA